MSRRAYTDPTIRTLLSRCGNIFLPGAGEVGCFSAEVLQRDVHSSKEYGSHCNNENDIDEKKIYSNTGNEDYSNENNENENANDENINMGNDGENNDNNHKENKKGNLIRNQEKKNNERKRKRENEENKEKYNLQLLLMGALIRITR